MANLLLVLLLKRSAADAVALVTPATRSLKGIILPPEKLTDFLDFPVLTRK